MRAIDRNEVLELIPVRSLAAIAATSALLAWAPAAGADGGFSISVRGGDRSSHSRFHGDYHGRFHGHPRTYRSFRYRYGYPGYYGWRPYYGPYWRPGYTYEPYWRPGYTYRWYPRPVEPRCIYRYGYLYCR